MTGLIGGTFDPPHLGHLILAEEARIRFGLERVVFVPCVSPPHKTGEIITPLADRLRMTELAVGASPEFVVESFEEAARPSGQEHVYTVDLLRWFNGRFERPAFVMGMDSLCEITTWREPEAVLELARVVAGSRPGYEPSAVPREMLSKVEIFDIPDVHIASTDLRQRFARGEECRYLTPAPVVGYVLGKGLYAGTGKRD